MLLRTAVLVLAGSVLAGCANNQPFSSGLAGPAHATEHTSAVEPDPGRKTLAGKVLTAIALERVTGRKPDPARLNELH